MAIVTISQIKHRRGVKGSDPMPQLASAEFGWAVDQQELYIGNGTITEGAPVTGNTQILTEHSDLSVLLSDYTYTGPFVGATMQTGPTAGTPIVRSNDEHDDASVDVRDFGALGDGVTDDTLALQRAITQHAGNILSNRYWTTIYVPAGTYVLSNPIQLPARTRLVGDGFNSTVFQLGAGEDKQVIELAHDNVFAAAPVDIYVAGIGFTAQNSSSAKAVCGITNGSNITFSRCAFTGASADTTVATTPSSCVLFNFDSNHATAETTNVKFDQCLFTGATYGVATSTEQAGDERRQDVNNVVINSCVFTNLYKGIVLGHETGTNPDANPFPREWRIVNSFFDDIARHGIHGKKATKCTSAMNHFADVGNNQLGATNQVYPNITFGDNGGNNALLTLTDYEENYSIGDHFDRDDTDADPVSGIRRVESFCNDSYIIDPDEIRYGSLSVEPGRLIRLIDNTLSPAATGIALDSTVYEGAIIDYQITRGDEIRRTGTLTIVLGVVDQAMNDDFLETAVSPGAVFTLTTAGGIGTVNYTLAAGAPAQDAVLSYSIRHLTCKAAAPITPLTVTITFPGVTQDDGVNMTWTVPSQGAAGTIVEAGGIAPYTYSWLFDDVGVTVVDTTVRDPTFQGADQTSNVEVTLTVTDAMGVQASDQATITLFEVGA
jgi:hypothetical protein